MSTWNKHQRRGLLEDNRIHTQNEADLLYILSDPRFILSRYPRKLSPPSFWLLLRPDWQCSNSPRTPRESCSWIRVTLSPDSTAMMAHFGEAGVCTRLKMPIGLRLQQSMVLGGWASCWASRGLRGSLAKMMTMLEWALTGIYKGLYYSISIDVKSRVHGSIWSFLVSLSSFL